MSAKKTKKLQLNKSTLRNLSDDSLGGVIGGIGTVTGWCPTQACTRFYCPTRGCTIGCPQ